MKFTAGQIATILNGTVDGDAALEVTQLSKIEEGTHGSLTFLANPKYTQHIYSTNASLVIVNKDFKPEKALTPTLIRVPDAYQAFTTLLEYYNSQQKAKAGIEKTAIIGNGTSIAKTSYIGHYSIIGENVTIGKNVTVHSHVIIEDNVVIGDDSVIHPNSIVHSDTQMGSFCVIHSGCVIGSDGFGFAPKEDGSYKKIPQTGTVIIADHVDIGANSTIDRATLGATKIGKGVKLDNQIQIAHNVEVGEHTVIAAQTGIAGSTKIGKNCIIGGQVGIVGHLKIGDNVSIQGQSGVTSSIEDKKTLYGTPAFSYNDYIKSYIYFKRFPSIVKRLESLEKKHS
ncbi:UDP-3-O-(3-hydroxymyristoyl)glucosamine N-acyltransferase [Flavobacteriaceae bacterium]|nr:UDP-3-O-(3-hydroxymyristoyl)glucosamine N-acyltransferase [Flavobacteriaceae bacterium]